MNPTIEAHFLRLDSAGKLFRKLRAAGHPRPAVGVAEALIRSPAAAGLTDFVMATRQEPAPLLVLAGPTVPSGRVRLRDLQGLLHEAGERIRILGWPDVERASTDLASKVVGVLGPAGGDARIVPVPRGGLIVAGLLAYALGAPASRIGEDASLFGGPMAADSNSGQPPILVVDDIVLSGVRLREVLRGLPPGRQVVVASLASHPELREIVRSTEPRVDAFVSAIDLDDHATGLLGDSADSWRQVWSERVPERYHTALLDMVVFPWSEPPLRLWNHEEGKLEEGWRVAPPELCFRTRETSPALPLQVVDPMPGLHRLAPEVVPVELADRTLLLGVPEVGQVESSRSVTLRGTAREIWHLWMPEGRQAAVEGMQHRYPDVDPDRIRRDVDALLTQLSDAGIARLDP